MIAYSTLEIENYINGLTDLQKKLVLETREAILSADNRIKETIKWGSIAFFNKKNICGYRVARNHVTLVFFEGVKLKDTYNVLSGDGSKVRNYKASPNEEVHKTAIADLVRQSLEMGL